VAAKQTVTTQICFHFWRTLTAVSVTVFITDPTWAAVGFTLIFTGQLPATNGPRYVTQSPTNPDSDHTDFFEKQNFESPYNHYHQMIYCMKLI